MLRDHATAKSLVANRRERLIIIKRTEDSNHNQFKFTNIELPDKPNNVGSKSSLPMEAELKGPRPERLVLKDLLVEAGTDFREQLDEMVKGFPKVRRVLNIDDESDKEPEESKDNVVQ